MIGSAGSCISIFLATLMLLNIFKSEKKNIFILWLTKIGNFGAFAQLVPHLFATSIKNCFFLLSLDSGNKLLQNYQLRSFHLFLFF